MVRVLLLSTALGIVTGSLWLALAAAVLAALVAAAVASTQPKSSPCGGVTIDELRSMMSVLVQHGFHPLTAWWDAQCERFLTHPTAKELYERVGRGGAKSYVGTMLSICIVLFGVFVIPPGERHYWVLISVNREEAAQRLRLIEEALTKLGVAYTRSGDTIDLQDMPRGFRVFTCTIGAVSGFRCLGYFCDEVCKWRNSDDSMNPAPEVIASIRAMCITHAQACGFLFSSPLSTFDIHYARVEAGDDEYQLVGIAPTWVANPAITEADTHAREPDQRVWSREYAAIPGSADQCAFDRTDIADCVDTAVSVRLPQPATMYICGFDASGGARDPYALVVAHRELHTDDKTGTRDDVVVDLVARWVPPVDFDWVLSEVARIVRSYGATLYRDSFGGDAIESALRRFGVDTRRISNSVASMSPTAQRERFTLLSQRIKQRTLRLTNNADLIRELCALRERVHAGGRLSWEAPRGQTDDLADALALCVDKSREIAPGGESNVLIQERWHWNESGVHCRVTALYPHVDPDTGIETMREGPLPPAYMVETPTQQRDRQLAGLHTAEELYGPGGSPFAVPPPSPGPRFATCRTCGGRQAVATDVTVVPRCESCA